MEDSSDANNGQAQGNTKEIISMEDSGDANNVINDSVATSVLACLWCCVKPVSLFHNGLKEMNEDEYRRRCALKLDILKKAMTRVFYFHAHPMEEGSRGKLLVNYVIAMAVCQNYGELHREAGIAMTERETELVNQCIVAFRKLMKFKYLEQ